MTLAALSHEWDADRAAGLLLDEAVRTVDATPLVTVMVPTRNEAGNVAPLVARVAAALDAVAAEILFVDDSDDDTPAEVERVASSATVPVRLLHRRPGDRTGGLGG